MTKGGSPHSRLPAQVCIFFGERCMSMTVERSSNGRGNGSGVPLMAAIASGAKIEYRCDGCGGRS
jgi:hypothetical protein